MSLSNDIVDAIQKANQKKTSAYDSVGTVTRVEDGVAWVHIAGGVDETPVQMTINAKAGDQVQVRVAGGRAWLVGNASSPPTDDATAKEALDYGKIANDAAQKAVQDSLVASEAAGRAQRTAEAVEGIARHAEEVAESVEGIAQQASEDAEDAKESAGVAKTAADNAVLSLSNVQDVVGVLDWITNHGTMTSQAGETFDANNVYFVVDQNGDYVIGGTHYSLVTNPVAADIDSYYCLSIDRSIQNYVATHIVVDSEGLWIIPDSGGNKVLIATGGARKTYETAGTYIVGKVGNDDVTLAKFLRNNAQIGQDASANLKMEFNRLVISDKNKNDFLKIEDLRDEDGYATFTETHYGNGSTQFNLGTNQIDSIVSVMVDGVDKTSAATIRYADAISITPAPPSGAVVEITYRSISDVSKEFTFGKRSDSNIGSMSVAFGDLTEASGYYSCAFGYGAKARGRYSFTAGGKANGDNSSAFNSGEANGDVSFASGISKANGRYSHAQNRNTVAGYDSQTAIGKFNDNQQNNAFEIGNGTDANNRSNAFEVDWNGNTTAAGDIEDGSGNVLADKLQEDNNGDLSITRNIEVNGESLNYIDSTNTDDAAINTALTTLAWTACKSGAMLLYKKTMRRILEKLIDLNSRLNTAESNIASVTSTADTALSKAQRDTVKVVDVGIPLFSVPANQYKEGTGSFTVPSGYTAVGIVGCTVRSASAIPASQSFSGTTVTLGCRNITSNAINQSGTIKIACIPTN